MGETKAAFKTPHLDRLAAQGMRCTDAHSSSAVCTPSRNSVLTGLYNWRSTLQKGIVGVYGDSLIAEDRLTVPGFLKGHGYHSACIGKWHLARAGTSMWRMTSSGRQPASVNRTTG